MAYVIVQTAKPAENTEAAIWAMRERIIPGVKGRPGFRLYCSFMNPADGSLVSVIVLADQQSARNILKQIHEIASQIQDALTFDLHPLLGRALVYEDLPLEVEGRADGPLYVAIDRYECTDRKSDTKSRRD
jgi:hypothetical protein